MQRLFGTWLEETEDLQLSAYAHDLRGLEGEAWAAEVRMNVTAIVAELGELLAECPGWKTWVTKQGRPASMGAAQGEFVDVQHFMANLAVLLSLDDVTLSELYAEKMQRNRERQATGTYDGVTGKCPHCTRALDDVGVETVHIGGILGDYLRCKGCGGRLNRGSVIAEDAAQELY